jgi:hypothetical protein
MHSCECRKDIQSCQSCKLWAMSDWAKVETIYSIIHRICEHSQGNEENQLHPKCSTLEVEMFQDSPK